MAYTCQHMAHGGNGQRGEKGSTRYRQSRQRPQIDRPTYRASKPTGHIAMSRGTKQNRESHRPDKGRQQLDGPPGGDRILDRHPQLHNCPHHLAIDNNRQCHTQSDAKEDQKGIRKPGGPGDIVFVGQVAHTVRKRDSRHKGNYGANYHVGQMQLRGNLEMHCQPVYQYAHYAANQATNHAPRQS